MDNIVFFLLCSLATGSIATTITKSEVFKPMQGIGPRWFQYLMRCPWCLSHWISAVLILTTHPWPGLFYFIVWWGAITIGATYASVLLMKLLFIHEQEKHTLRTLLDAALAREKAGVVREQQILAAMKPAFTSRQNLANFSNQVNQGK